MKFSVSDQITQGLYYASYINGVGSLENNIVNLSGTRWTSIRDFEIVKNIFEKGSVTLAAQAMGISQPAVSKAVSNIEKKYGFSLFQREGGKLVSTKEGLYLYHEIVGIFESLERIDNSKWKLPDTKLELNVAAPPSFSHDYLAEATADFVKDNPNIIVRYIVSNSVNILNDLNENRADVALTTMSLANHLNDYIITPLPSTKLYALLNKKHPLSHVDKISVFDLVGRDIILFTLRHPLHNKLDELFRANQVTPNVVAEVSDTMTALPFVKKGLGIAFVPFFPTAEALDGDLILKDTDFEIKEEEAFFLNKNCLKPYARTYIAYIASHASKRMQELMRQWQ